jgi:diacylglycerol kinase family enzyme
LKTQNANRISGTAEEWPFTERAGSKVRLARRLAQRRIVIVVVVGGDKRLEATRAWRAS